MSKNYVDYMVEETKNILAIDSPSGYTKEVADYVMGEYKKLGYEPKLTVKGGVLVPIGGRDKENAVLLEAHIDTLGAMVAEIKANGRLRVTAVGGMNANNAEGENCKVVTRFNGKYDGTLQLINASIHVNGEYNDTKRSYDSVEVVLDEKVKSKEDVEKLGIMTGDFVCFDPRTTVTESGYIKSRFLDDKLSVGILLGYAKYLKEENVTPDRMIYQHITVFEEVGHGGAASVPEGVTEVISVDMGCVGDGLACDETQVSICAKDSHGPYHYDVVNGLSFPKIYHDSENEKTYFVPDSQMLYYYFIYKTDKKMIEGLGILNITTEWEPERLIRNIILQSPLFSDPVVGFENHGGRTYINDHTPFGKVFFGLGNTGKSGYEGVVYKNVIATYLHGPLLPKNPQVCDYLLERALQRKYGENVSLSPLPDELEHKANSYIFDRYNDKKYVLQETIKRYT